MIVRCVSSTAYTKRFVSSIRRDQNPDKFSRSGSGFRMRLRGSMHGLVLFLRKLTEPAFCSVRAMRPYGLSSPGQLAVQGATRQRGGVSAAGDGWCPSLWLESPRAPSASSDWVTRSQDRRARHPPAHHKTAWRCPTDSLSTPFVQQGIGC